MPISSVPNYQSFKQLVFDYYLSSGRSFPWRDTADPYAITVSEIMLQQTQAERVVPKYLQFLEKYPTWEMLAKASNLELFSVWQGLGYNRRALNLKRMAEVVVQSHGGALPQAYDALLALPGIGPYTAGAILAFAFNEAVPVIETNIRRVYIHHFFADREGVSDKELLPIIEATLDRENPREWYYALMDYGSHLVRDIPNPNLRSKHYVKQGKFEGSVRQVRGAVLRYVTEKRKVPRSEIGGELRYAPDLLNKAIAGLVSDRMLSEEGGILTIE